MTTMRPSGEPVSEQQRQNRLMHPIGNAVMDIVPERWRRVDLMVKMNVVVRDLALGVHLEDGSTADVEPPDGRVAAAFGELRRLLFRPGRGTWLAARLSMNPPGGMYISYNLDHDPKWFPPIPASYWVRDLEAFPRDGAFVPNWLREKLDEARRAEPNL